MAFPTPEDIAKGPKFLSERFTLEELTGAHKRVSPVGFMARLGSGFGKTPEEQRNILRSMGHDAEVRNGRVFVNGRPVDPEGFEAGDIADVVGEVPEIVGGAAGGIGGAVVSPPAPLVGGMGGATLGGTAGSLVRQGIAAQLGSQETPSVKEAAKVGAIEGTIGEPLGAFGGGLFKRAFGTFSKGARTGGAEGIESMADLLDESQQLKKSLPPASLSSDPRVGAIQNFVQEAPTTARRAEEQMTRPFEEQKGRVLGDLQEEVGPSVSRGEVGVELPGARKAAQKEQDKVVDTAFDKLEEVWPHDVPPDMKNFKGAINEALDRRAFSELSGGPGSGETLIDNLLAWGEFADQVKTFKGLRGFKTRLQDAVQKEELGSLGNMLEGALFDDLRAMRELTTDSVSQIGGQFGGPRIPQTLLDRTSQEAGEAFDEAMSLSKEQFDIADSPTVKGIFDLREGENVGRVVELVFRKNNPAGAKRFLQSVNGITEKGFEATEEGLVKRNQVARVWLDDVVEKSADDRTGQLSGIRFLKNIFGASGPGRETLELMFDGDTLRRMELFGTFLKESDVGERSFSAVSQSGVRAELIAAFYNPVRYATVIAPLEATLGRVVTSGKGKKFLLEGLGDPRKAGFVSRLGAQTATKGVEPLFSK